MFCSGDYFRAALEYEEVNKTAKSESLYLKYILAQWRCGNTETVITELPGIYADQKPLFVKLVSALALTKDSGQLPDKNALHQIYLADSNSFTSVFSLIDNLRKFRTGMDVPLLIEPAAEQSEELLRLRSAWITAGWKSPFWAGVFSAVLPGSGKIYTGDTDDGITAFILTSVFSYLAYTNFEHEHTTRAWIFTLSTAGFYLGNIYGSVISAQLHNRKTEFAENQKMDNFIRNNGWFLNIKMDLPCFP